MAKLAHSMYVQNGFGFGQVQQIVVALEILGMIFELVASKVVFLKLELLNHCAHGAVNDHYPFTERGSQFIEYVCNTRFDIIKLATSIDSSNIHLAVVPYPALLQLRWSPSQYHLRTRSIFTVTDSPG